MTEPGSAMEELAVADRRTILVADEDDELVCPACGECCLFTLLRTGGLQAQCQNCQERISLDGEKEQPK